MVAVLGFGHEGKSLVRYLHSHGCKPTIFDEREFSDFTPEEQTYLQNSGLTFIVGKDSFSELKGFDVLFRSPGIYRKHPALRAEEKRGAHITGQTAYFLEHCPATVIGVTGTKGKGTTCSLIHSILLEAISHEELSEKITKNTKAYLTGNIGKESPLDILDQLTSDDLVVFEMSSFQLEDLQQSPAIAVVLMVTQDHVGPGSKVGAYHDTLADYHQAKSAIVSFQKAGDIALYNLDYEASVRIGEKSVGQKYTISRQIDSATAYISGDTIMLHCDGEEVVDVSKRVLRGAHNMENIAAAALVTRLLGVRVPTIVAGVCTFPGLEHRLELVTEKNGILFYNDSIATTPDATIAALQSFSEPVVVILGGSSKGADFTPLGVAIASAKNVKAVILIGETANDIEKSLQAGNSTVPIIRGARTMQEVFVQLHAVASSGDVVLLSPGCASFDMFSSYADRGNQFKKYANAW